MDEKIRDLISILNSRGIRTTGSCEGHINQGSPAPWVKFTPLRRTTSGEKNCPRHRRGRTEENQVLHKTSQYLSEFYKTWRVPRDASLMIEKANFGFWIHNGGDSYSRWRKFVNKSVVQVRSGKNVKAYVDKEERAHRSKHLAVYQKEIEAFAKFLKRTANRK